MRREIGKMNNEICAACGAPLATESGSMLCSKCMDYEPSFDTIKITVLLDKVADIKDFVNLASKCSDDVTIGSGRFAVDAKSIMGLFSLDLSKPLKVEFYGNIPYEVKVGMKKFIVNED
jgi:hypothetical protein